MTLNKYWKSIVACIVIVACVGTYYVSAFIENQSYPSFDIQTVEGDETLIEPIVLSGYYTEDVESFYFQLTDDDFLYRHQLSIIDDMRGVPFSYEKRLKDRYRGLIRGSGYAHWDVVENEDYIARTHVDIEHDWKNDYWEWEATLHVNVIHKESGKLTKMKYDFDSMKEEDQRPPYIDDIQLNDEEVIVFILGSKREAEVAYAEVDTYTFDLDTRKFKEKKTILSEDQEEKSIYKLYQSPYWLNNEYVIYRVVEETPWAEEEPDVREEEPEHHTGYNEEEQITSDEADSEQAEQKMGSNQLYAYDVNSQQLEEIYLPEELQYREVDLYDGSNLYFTETTTFRDDTLTVFDVASESIVSEVQFDGLKPGNQRVFVYDGLIYVTGLEEGDSLTSMLHVYEATTGDRLYTGKVVSEQLKAMDDMYLDGLQFRY